jgi:methylase of polypeptide subunit release factors
VLAIDGGDDGLSVVRECLTAIAKHLADGGVALLQLGPGDQAEAVTRLLAETQLSAGEAREFDDRGVLLRIDHRD